MINVRELGHANHRPALPACVTTVRRPTVAAPVSYTWG
jgi:hypothetical protein